MTHLRKAMLIGLAAFMVTACGIKGDVKPPSDRGSAAAAGR